MGLKKDPQRYLRSAFVLLLELFKVLRTPLSSVFRRHLRVAFVHKSPLQTIPSLTSRFVSQRRTFCTGLFATGIYNPSIYRRLTSRKCLSVAIAGKNDCNWQGFPSLTELSIFCAGAGILVPQLERWTSPW